MNETESFGVEDYAEKAETIDGDGPYEFDKTDLEEEVEKKIAKSEDMTFDVPTPDVVTNFGDHTPVPPIKMSKKRTVLNLQPANHGGDFAYFAQVNEETGQHDVAYHMSYDDWNDFGQPDVITVAVVPRDILN